MYPIPTNFYGDKKVIITTSTTTTTTTVAPICYRYTFVNTSGITREATGMGCDGTTPLAAMVPNNQSRNLCLIEGTQSGPGMSVIQQERCN